MEVTQSLNEATLNISGEPWIDFLIRLVVNIVSIFILIRFIYYPNNSRVKYLFTFFLMGMMIFLIASILDQVKLDIGIAFGLFAIFGIIRYRSPSIDLKEMTYLFLVIGVSIINALVAFKLAAWLGLLIANFIVLIAAYIMEKYVPKNYVLKRMLVYTPSDYSVLNNKDQLLQEIRENTGINVLKVEVSKINKAKNEITAWIFFRENSKYVEAEKEIETPEPQVINDGWESSSSNEY